MPYGSLGYLSTWTNPQDFADLPDWLRRQIVPTNQDEGTTTYGFGQGLFDRSGRQVSQLSPNAFSDGADGSLIDPNAHWEDPDGLGDVSGTENLRHVQSASFRNGLLATQLAIAAMTGYGAYSALGAGAGGAGAGLGAAAEPFAGAVAEGSISGLGAGTAAGAAGAIPMGQISVTAPSLAGAGGLSATQLGGLLGGAGAAANVFDGSTVEGDVEGDDPFAGSHAEGDVTGPGFLDSLAANPLQTLGRMYSLYQLGGGLLNRNNGDDTNNPDDNDGKGGNGDAVNVPRFQGRDPYTPNPFTQSQIQNFRYTGR